MHIEFKYRYYENDNDFTDYELTMEHHLDTIIAYRLKDVGDVIHFAEKEQHRGCYVVLYLTYEAAPFFNQNMSVKHFNGTHIFAAAYSFKNAKKLNNNQCFLYEKPYLKTHTFQFNESNESMINKIKLIQQAIVEGYTYQVNYTTRLKSSIICPIKELYDKLTGSSNGNYTALIDTPDIQVASISPELFFQKGDFNGDKNVVVSKPMKGTMPRGQSIEEDKRLLYALNHSAKDKAENVMIVDLLRNDITRISKSGSIQVHQPFLIEQYETVFQMTSTVSGQLRNEINLVDIMSALFPCGSITGAPKISTMQYIEKLEDTPRSIYCGTIGLLLPHQRMIFNIPIRTIEYINGEAIYGVGAGITIDSIPENEVQEFYDKTKILERL